MAAAAAALLLWWAWPQRASPTAAPGPLAAASAAAPHPYPRPHSASAAPSVLTAPEPLPLPRAAARAASVAAGETVDLCGVGPVPVLHEPDPTRPGPLAGLPDHLGRHALEAARQRTLTQMERGSLRQRVAAWLWRDLHAPPGNTDRAGAQRLVHEALASQDALAQGTAASRLCTALDEPAACTRALLEAALRSDPGNARWHALAMVQGSEPSWQALLQAPAWRSDLGQLAAGVRTALPPDLPPYLATALLVEGLGLDFSVMDNVGPVLRRCLPNAPPAERAPRADCDRLAHLMVERSDTLLTLLLGLKVAADAGWPADTVASLRAEADALQAAGVQSEQDQGQPLGCAAGQAFERYVDTLAREGELAALRALPRR